MNKTEAYGQCLKAAKAALEAAKAMLPSDAWGHNADPDEADEAQRLDRVLEDLGDASIPI